MVEGPQVYKAAATEDESLQNLRPPVTRADATEDDTSVNLSQNDGAAAVSGNPDEQWAALWGKSELVSAWGAWSADCTFPLQGTDAENKFQGKARLINTPRVTSVRTAVQLLNDGDLECPEDFCIVYSTTLRSHYVLFRVGKATEALNAFGVDAPIACIPRCRCAAVKGIDDRVNQCVLFSMDNSSGKRRKCVVVYFPGDLQDRTAEDMRNSGHGQWDNYNLHVTAQELASKHNASHCLCVRAFHLKEGTYAGYGEFCPLWDPEQNTVSGYDGHRGRATEHLVALLENSSILSSDYGFEAADIDLVGFSRGCVVINQLIAELAQASADRKLRDSHEGEHFGKYLACQRLWTRVCALHNVDGANIHGPSYPLPEDSVAALKAWMEFRDVNAQEVSAEVLLPVGTHVDYLSSSNQKWIRAVVTHSTENGYDLNVRARADPAKVRLPVGAKVEYLSSTHGRWIPAQVNAYNEEFYCLDVRPEAEPSKVRLRQDETLPKAISWNVHFTPYTLLGIPGKLQQQRKFFEAMLPTFDNLLHGRTYHEKDPTLNAHFKTLEDYIVLEAQEKTDPSGYPEGTQE